MNTEKFIEKANIVHNGSYNYDKVVYKKSSEKVIITCKLHGDFSQTPNNHINNKQRCPCCFGKIKHDTSSFIERCNEVHSNKYDYSKVEYTNNKEKVIIICPLHGEFLQKAVHHLAGKDCMKCAAAERAEPKKYDTEKFVKLAKNKHDGLYNYDNVIYKNSTTKVSIICSLHGEFKQRPAQHLSGQGCPQCIDNISNGTKEITKYLSDNNISFVTEKRFDNCRNKKPLPFDFYIEDLNICIEYDGEQHYRSISKWGGDEGLEYRQLNDSIKNEYCKNNDIKLIRIRYDEDVTTILKEKLI